MLIQTKGWNIAFDNTPGAEGLRVSGLVSVPGGAFDASLSQAPDETSDHLQLEIVLPLWCESTPAPLTDKSVSFFAAGPMRYNTVSVRYEGETILAVTDFLMQRKP